jgi:hypothetical protein
VENTIAKYGIRSDDIYNFDETGFMMGMISTRKVATRAQRRGKPKSVQPGNREWVTVIEGINHQCGRLGHPAVHHSYRQEAPS